MTRITIENIERTTEKAILAAVEVEVADRRIARKIWFPLSQVKMNEDQNELIVPEWLAKAKLVDEFGAHVGCSAWFN